RPLLHELQDLRRISIGAVTLPHRVEGLLPPRRQRNRDVVGGHSLPVGRNGRRRRRWSRRGGMQGLLRLRSTSRRRDGQRETECCPAHVSITTSGTRGSRLAGAIANS